MPSMKLLVPLLGIFLTGSTGQEVVSGKANQETAVDPCIEKGVQDLIASLKTKYPKLEAVTSALDTSRLLYQRLLNPELPGVLREYCSLYQEKRQSINRCPDSTGKTITLNGFSLADEICQKRLEDFAKNLPCIVSLPDTSATCQPTCSQFEQDSRSYVSPLSGNQADAKNFKPGDCKYVKCQAECRRPIIDKKCGSEAAGLETAALSATFAGERIVYGLGQQAQPFPQECRELILIAAADTPATNGTSVPAASGSNGSAPSAGGTGASADAPAPSGAAAGVTGAPGASGVPGAPAAGTGAPAGGASAAGGAVTGAPAPGASGGAASGNGTGAGGAATAKPPAAGASSNGSGSGSTATNGTAGAAPSGGNGTSGGTSSGAAAPAPSSNSSSSASGGAAAPAPAANTATQKPNNGAVAPRAEKMGTITAIATAGLTLVAAIIV